MDREQELPSFKDIEERHKAVSEQLDFAKEYTDDLTEKINNLETQLDAIITMDEYAKKEQLRRSFSQDEIEALRLEIASLKEELVKLEKGEIRLVRQRDCLELLDQKLQQLIFNMPPTEEKNPDDSPK